MRAVTEEHAWLDDVSIVSASQSFGCDNVWAAAVSVQYWQHNATVNRRRSVVRSSSTVPR